jgi:wyosine [tRNA(Phe)-imidazoG37] synthetase (radical SAM superfamily)
LAEEAERHLEGARGRGERVDYLTIVPDGEPTLDLNLGELLQRLRKLDVPLAMISNGSLSADPGLREELEPLDWISVKVDSAHEETWRRIDRPHKEIDFQRMLSGIRMLGESFSGTLTTETMLVAGINDSEEELAALAELIESIDPCTAYLSVPTRPPAEPWVRPAPEEALASAYVRLSASVPRVENLIGYEGSAFSASGDARNDLLSTTSVHPMRREAALELLQKDGASPELLDELVSDGQLREVDFAGHRYYVRRFRR